MTDMFGAVRNPSWEVPQSIPALPSEQIQVWQASATGLPLEASLPLLTPEELLRVHRLHTPLARSEFALGRAILRRLLGAALDLSPLEVPLQAEPGGKLWTPGVYFNLSHSHGSLLIALSRSVPVGVDLEWRSPGISPEEALDLAKLNFAPSEFARISAADPGPGRLSLFFHLWTAKEAALKALGLGLRTPLQRVEVPHAPACPELPVTVSPDAGSTPHSLKTVFVRYVPVTDDTRWAAALAVPGVPGVPARLLDCSRVLAEITATLAQPRHPSQPGGTEPARYAFTSHLQT